MNRKNLLFLLSIVTTLHLNAGSNRDLPDMGNGEKGLLKKFNISMLNIEDPYNIPKGIHCVTSQGWYVTTKNIADNLKKISDHKDDFFIEHEDLDLTLIKFKKSLQNFHTIFLDKIEANTLTNGDWVLSLSKINPLDNFILYGALSQITHLNDNLITLNKGDLKDFYQQINQKIKKQFINNEKAFSHELLITLANSDFSRVDILVQEKIKKIKQDIIFLDFNATGLSHTIKILEDNQQNSEQFEEDLIKTKNLIPFVLKYEEALNHYLSPKKPTESTLHNELDLSNNIPDLSYLILKMQDYILALDQRPMIRKEIDSIWNSSGRPYNGVADNNDIGGGIYHYLTKKLIGITIDSQIEGDTSTAINLTTPEIKNWMINTINKYYKCSK